MRRLFASAMLCVLLLLSVAVVRCEAQCSFAAMPMAMQPVSPADSAVAMDSSMEHCDGMRGARDGLMLADAACGTSMCRHQALPSTSDSRIDVDRAQLMQPVTVQIADVPTLLQGHRQADSWKGPPLPQRSPLDRSSSLRV